jgi:hypothetical protein
VNKKRKPTWEKSTLENNSWFDLYKLNFAKKNNPMSELLRRGSKTQKAIFLVLRVLLTILNIVILDMSYFFQFTPLLHALAFCNTATLLARQFACNEILAFKECSLYVRSVQLSQSSQRGLVQARRAKLMQ